MISHQRQPRTPAFLMLLSIALTTASLWASTASALQPPPNNGGGNEQGAREPRDGDGRRGERPRDRIRRRIDERRQGRSGPDDELPTELTDRVMEMLRNNLPEAYAKLDKLRERNPERFRNAIRAVIPTFKEYMMLLKDERPDLAKGIVQEFKNERRLAELSREYRDATNDSAKQAQITQEIDTLVRQQMEFHLQHMSFRLDQFEKRIKEQQEMLQKHRTRYEEEKSKLNEHVAQRVEEIKKGNLRRPNPPPPPGGPGMGGPPGGPRGPGNGPPPGPDGRPRPPRHRSPDDGPPRFDGPPEGPPPDEPPPPDNDDSGDE